MRHCLFVHSCPYLTMQNLIDWIICIALGIALGAIFAAFI